MSLPEPSEASVPASTVVQWMPVEPADRDRLLAFFASVAGSRQVGDVPGREDAHKSLGNPGPDVHELAWSGGDLIGYAVLSKRDATDETRDLSLSVILRPDRRTTQIDEEVRRWLELRINRIHARLPHPHDLRIYASTQRDDPWAAGLLTGCGFRMERAFADMRVSLPTGRREPASEGDRPVARFSPLFAEEVRIACNEAFDGHWGTSPWSPRLWREDVMGDPDFLPDISFLAMTPADGAVEAFVLTSDAMEGGRPGHIIHVDLVGTRKASRGAGLATRLLRQTLRSAAAAGYGEATLSVDTDGRHGALAIYRRLGFKVVDGSLYWCLVGPVLS